MKAVVRISLGLLPALALLGPAAARAEAVLPEALPAALKVEPDRVLAPVNRNVLSGFNFGNAMVADFVEDLQAVRAGEIRLGGESSDRNDLGEATLQNLKASFALLGGPAGLAAVVQTRVGWLGTQGGEPRNKPEDAADAVRWAKGMGLPVRYWEIGNEPDLYGQKQSAADYGPEKYCATFRAQAAAMKAVDPGVRVAGPAVSGVRPARDRFLEGFVKECGDAVDVVTWHVYPTDGSADDEAAFATASEADDSVAQVKALWADPRRNPRGHQRQVELGVTEYGLSWQSPRARHLADLPAAMWAMEVALRLDAAGAASAHYFSIQGTLNHGLLDPSGARRPTWYAFSTLARLSGSLVPAQSGDREVWAHAARSGNRLDVILLNTSPAAKPLAAAVPGFTLRHAHYFDEAVTKDERPMATLAVGPTVTLPARSVVHLVFAQDGTTVADEYAPRKVEPEKPAKGARKAPARKKP
jgi:hypothetical protein